MSKLKYINIDFPFSESEVGHYVKLNSLTNKAIRADLMHLLLTNKGERFYMPDFGTNLLKYIYQQNDSFTLSEIKSDVKETVKKYIPNLNIDELEVNFDEQNEYKANIKINYTITDGVFKDSDFIIINI